VRKVGNGAQAEPVKGFFGFLPHTPERTDFERMEVVDTGEPNRLVAPLTSRKASSRLRGSTAGVTDPKIAMTFLEMRL
jgi:hypothetical protein